MASIQLDSPAFGNHDEIPARYAHTGENISPPLRWSGLPESATELILLCEDPDAPSTTFLHWLVTGIDPASNGVSEGQIPRGGQEWPNGFGEPGWGGPQPPPGDPAHRFVFHLYALGQPIQLPDQPSAYDVHRHVDEAAVASGTTVGLFQR
ncbi:YbhB/YbcL family Raf kinase inhibitor-like protein [Rugosimonospora acidiphila]|uniref:YbhB/YbcL family Raf kinase inhibitor-like protein n=1 Tax=Rugosimonospora acidiphila TaxID=556531 RepID=A0ABP9SHV2_9ACTN